MSLFALKYWKKPNVISWSNKKVSPLAVSLACSLDMSENMQYASLENDGDPSSLQIRMLARVIEQQDKMIRLVEIIAGIHGAVSKRDAATTVGSSAPADGQLTEDATRIKLKLYRAAVNGDWAVAKRIYNIHEGEIGAAITERGDTALHVAAAGKHIDFVKELVKMMTAEEIAKPNKYGSTALVFAAASGISSLARMMMAHNKAIAMVRDYNQRLPIYMAASLGHKEMLVYLYQQTKDSLNDKDRVELLVSSIETDLYDVALQLLRDCPQLATYRARNCETALHALARKDLSSSNFAHQNDQGGFFRRYLGLGAKDVETKRLQALNLVEYLWERVVLLSDSEISELISKPGQLVFDAAKQGNINFLSILLREYPNLVWSKVDGDKYSIFHVAVLDRQEHIFKLIYEMTAAKELIVASRDRNGNNILHLAALLPPQDRLNIVSGAALQMQRELLWFKEVKKVVQRNFAEAKNREGLTPKALFTKEHRDLREAGERWMKDTATSCMFVATLIATVVFAAAFTVPGSNREDTGFPFFLKHVSFKVFAISDAVSLVSSSTSIVNFLSILTSRYAEEDFLELLPRKLLLGLATLFVSMVAMMVVFSSTFFIVFHQGRLWIAILVTVISSLPVILFIWQHFQLFYDVLRSTYVSDSLFQVRRTRLFRKQGEASERQRNTKIFDRQLTIQSKCSTNV